MRLYLQTIQFLQKFFLIVSIALLLTLPLLLVFLPDGVSEGTVLNLYATAHVSVFFVMLVRPLADIFTQTRWIRPLVILRKGVGVLSASIVVSFMFAKIIVDGSGYFSAFGTLAYWSFTDFALFAHLADISGIILLATSNNLSKRVLGLWWKRVQKLSYVFFYSSSLYVYLSFGDISLLFAMSIITGVTILAYFVNKRKIITNQ